MSIKHFCDGCKAEVTPDNRLFKSTAISYNFPETGTDFEFSLSYASNANGTRIISNDGDLCKACFHEALRSYLAEIEEAELDKYLEARDNELLQVEPDDDDGAEVYVDEDEEEAEDEATQEEVEVEEEE